MDTAEFTLPPPCSIINGSCPGSEIYVPPPCSIINGTCPGSASITPPNLIHDAGGGDYSLAFVS
jgi:hypothetical protein